MSTLEDRLLDRVRMELGDLSFPFSFELVGDGERTHFNIEHRPVNMGSLWLSKDGVRVDDHGAKGVLLDSDAGMLVFPDPPLPGEVWTLQGQKWRYFSDDDHRIFINTALLQHSHNRGDSSGADFTVADVPPVEEYPVALLAVIQALWALATDAAFDIDIFAPDGVNIPRSERYRQLMDMISARQTQYDEIAQALNVGIGRLETFTVRRTAKNTNRLVPVYLPQEYDDRGRPKRVLFPPMLQGTAPVETGIANYDWNIVSGDPASATFDFDFDITGCVIETAIRRGAVGGTTHASVIGPPVGKFEMEIVDETAGTIRLFLSGKQTRSLQYNSYWEMQITKPGEEPVTWVRGLVKATNNEIVRGNP